MEFDNQEFYVCFEDFCKRYLNYNKKVEDFFSTKKFFLDETNIRLEKSFSKTNYKIVEKDLSKEFCYIFFLAMVYIILMI